ncbi:MAG TPA: hypothetical protein VGG28_17390 [Kofleriaceae bacterium]
MDTIAEYATAAARSTRMLRSAVIAIGAVVATSVAADPAPTRIERLWSAPSVSTDGTRIVVPMLTSGGGRGGDGLAFELRDRHGKVLDSVVEHTVDDAFADDGSAGDRAVAHAHHVAGVDWMTRVDARWKLVPLAATGPSATVELADNGTLTVRGPKHRVLASAQDDAWRAKPSAATTARMNEVLERGEVPCFNPASLGATYVDVAHEIAAAEIGFHGNDSCWEPAPVFAIVTW